LDFDMGMPYPGSPLGSPDASPSGPGSPGLSGWMLIQVAT
jgi:hypothetical protein